MQRMWEIWSKPIMLSQKVPRFISFPVCPAKFSGILKHKMHPLFHLCPIKRTIRSSQPK